MTAVKSPFILAFGAAAVVHLVLNATDVTPWDSITKCVLAPLLVAWVVQLDGPRLLVAALVFCFLGDLFLELDDLFAAGMAAFAAAHICFIVFFVRRGALDRLRTVIVPLVIYVLAAVGLLAWAWSGLDPEIRPLVPFYVLLLIGTAVTALALDRRAGVGGLMFLVSDAFIALGEADRMDKDAAWHGLVVMGLYIGSIFLLSTGILNREAASRHAARDGFDPTVRTDCWPRLPESAS
jgi:uncharacterized membrane protein YhhN